MHNILIIQTASIGDVILATPVIEKLHDLFPESTIDFLIKQGNESIFLNHPYIQHLRMWNKKEKKYINFLRILKTIRFYHYDCVINLQRFTSSGLLTVFSGAKITIGFNKNPLSFLFKIKVKHKIGNLSNHVHEADRNLSLLDTFSANNSYKIKLYPSKKDFAFVSQYKTSKYICIAPSSLWFTKQFPESRWVELIKNTDKKIRIYLLGSKSDIHICENIIYKSEFENAINLAGKLSLLESAALIKDAAMNFVNDSSPLHLASAMNAKVTAIFCSTVTYFGFGPKSDDSKVVEVRQQLKCRPCGIHGQKKCPEGHFKCAYNIDIKELTNRL